VVDAKCWRREKAAHEEELKRRCDSIDIVFKKAACSRAYRQLMNRKDVRL